MLRVIVAAVLMLSMAVILTAQNDGLSREELNRRREQLNAQAEQIKQETGFEGTISNYPPANRIISFRGHFEDIRVPAREDTVGFKHVFDEILDRILPYFPVDRADLTRGTLSSNVVSTSIRFNQTANGYDIEGASNIVVGYTHSLGSFFISNGLAYLDPAELPTEPVITEEEAIRVAVEAHREPDENRRVSVHVSNLIYSRDVRDRESEYFLYWYVNISGTSYYVNSITGIVDYSFTEIIDLTYNVSGRGHSVQYPWGAFYIHPIDGISIDNLGQNYPVVDGVVTIPDPPDQATFKAKLETDVFTIYSVSDDDDNIVSLNYNGVQWDEMEQVYRVTFEEDFTFPLGEPDGFPAVYSGNALFHLQHQYSFFSTLAPDVTLINGPKIILHHPSGVLGALVGEQEIRLFDGYNSHAARHEYSHFFVRRCLDNQFIYNGFDGWGNERRHRYQGMDEAYADYLTAIAIESPVLYSANVSMDISGADLTVQWVMENTRALLDSLGMGDLTEINEAFYANYFNKYPIASAWWALRDQLADFDQTLINILSERVSQLPPTVRYRPRAFFNLLMEHYPNDREEITTAYADRGMYFVPKVEIVNSEGESVDEFKENEEVHLRLSNLPQNTDFRIYLFKGHQSLYTIPDGTQIEGIGLERINNLGPNEDNEVIEDGSIEGEWSGLLWKNAQFNPSGYRVIVDLHYPGPNGEEGEETFFKLYQDANVVSGQGSFMVSNPHKIDVVFACDISPSINQLFGLRGVAAKIIGHFFPGDRLNAFGFSNEYAFPHGLKNWLHGDTQNDFFEVSIIPINLSQVIYGYSTNNFSCEAPTHILEGALERSFARFDLDSSRPKAVILVSDGRDSGDDINDPPSPIEDYENYINVNYVPNDIKIYTIHFEIPGVTPDPYSYELMRTIAEVSGGKFYACKNVYQTHIAIEDIFTTIRDMPAAKRLVGHYTPSDGEGEPITRSFNVEYNAHTISAILTFEGVMDSVVNENNHYNLQDAVDMDVKLISPPPDQNEYISSTLNFTDAWRYLFRIDIEGEEVVPGTWTASFIPRPHNHSLLPPDTYSHSLSISVYSDLRVSIDNYPVRRLNSDPFDIEVEVKDFNIPITDADVWVEVDIPGEQEYNIPLIHDSNNEGTYRFSYAAYPHDGYITFNKFIDIGSHNAQRRSSHTVYFEDDEEHNNLIVISILDIPCTYYQDPLDFQVEIGDSFGPITYADVWVEIHVDGPDPYYTEIDLIHDEQSEGNYAAEYIPEYIGNYFIEYCIYLPQYDYFISEVQEFEVYGD